MVAENLFEVHYMYTIFTHYRAFAWPEQQPHQQPLLFTSN